MEVRRNAEPLKNAACVGLGLPAAKLGKLLLELGRAYAVGIVKIGLVVDRVLLLAAVVKALVAHDYGVHDGVIIVHVLVLLEHRHALFRGYGNAAGGRLKLAGENFNKRRFSGSVCADYAVAVAGRKLQINARKQNVSAEIYRKIID